MDSKTTANTAQTPMTFGDFWAGCLFALFSKHPLANLRVVMRHAWQDVTGLADGPLTSARASTRMPVDQTGLILYAHRWGVYVAYIPEDLQDHQAGFNLMMLPPRPGMAVFSDNTLPCKTGTRRDLDRLARLTGRRLELVGDSAFYIPFTSQSSLDDASRFGWLILTEDAALVRWMLNRTEAGTGD